ncbi:MAG: DegV family protein [Clostridiales bacterium]|nr:DegV family protein [Clostridiales bacterium]
MPYRILTDSCANLTNAQTKENNISIIPLSFNIEDKQYKSYDENSPVDLSVFYEYMLEGKRIFTSCANREDIFSVMRPLLNAGEDILYICFSSALSATFDAAGLALADLRREYPNRKIYIVDSRCAALGEGLFVTLAARQKAAGLDIDALRDWCEANKLRVCHWFTVSDLRYLKQSGRLGNLAAAVANLLGIKPVLHVDDEGRLISMHKVRGVHRAIGRMVDQLEATKSDDAPIIWINDARAPELRDALITEIKSRMPIAELYTGELDPIIGAHSGPGTLALFFLGKER